MVQDVITGATLHIKDQLIWIDVGGGPSSSASKHSVKTIKDLLPLLLAPSPKRIHGTHEATPVLIFAGPGTGKTWSILQLHHLICEELHESKKENNVLIPLTIYVQKLARMLRMQSITVENIIPHYIESEFQGPENDWIRRVLVQARF